MVTLKLDFPKFLRDGFFNDKKYSCIAAGRRTGKTFNAFQWLVIKLLETPNKSGLWVDTTQRNLTEYVEIYLRKILNPIWSSVKHDKQAHKITFKNGSFIHMRSAERPENMEGFEYDFIVCNEAGIIFKTPELWLNTVMPMSKNAQVKFVGTPKGKNYFQTLFLGADTSEEWASYQYSAYDSPYWLAGQLDSIRFDPSMSEDIWKQEYLGEFVTTTSNIICKVTHKTSWRDDDDKPYSIDSSYIRKQIDDDGYFFLAFDGGMYTTHSAGVLGYYNERFSRRIYLKEFYNRGSHEDIQVVAEDAFNFCDHHKIKIDKLYGDPALKTYGDNDKIRAVFDRKIDCLESLQDNINLKHIFTDRKTKRLGRISDEMRALRGDNKPAIIILKENKNDKTLSYGCPQLYRGLLDGLFCYEVKDGNITKDLQQTPPVTDLCDAISYEILCKSPINTAIINNNFQHQTHRIWG